MTTEERPMPAAPELEQNIIAVLINEPASYWDIADTLRPEMFTKPEHRAIYQSITEMHKEGRGVDLLTLTDKMRQGDTLKAVGGEYFLTVLSGNYLNAANILEQSLIVKDRFIQSKVITASLKLSELAYTEDLDDIMMFIDTELLGMGDEVYRGSSIDIGRAVNESLKQIEKIYTRKEELSGITSGLKTVDHFTGGWQSSDLTIIAARPSMGKTALALHFAMAAALAGHAVGFFSMEMSATQLANRLIGREAHYSPGELRSGKITDWNKLEKDIKTLVNLPIYIDGTPSLSLIEFKSKAKRMVGSQGVQLIIVDYLQLMRGESRAGNREQEISSVSRTLKATAKELKIPIITCCQLNRAVEARGDKHPLLSDLRESGAIEQDADLVIGVFRPEYYGLQDQAGITELNILKHRNGPVGSCNVSHNQYLTMYFNEVQNVF